MHSTFSPHTGAARPLLRLALTDGASLGAVGARDRGGPGQAGSCSSRRGAGDVAVSFGPRGAGPHARARAPLPRGPPAAARAGRARARVAATSSTIPRCGRCAAGRSSTSTATTRRREVGARRAGPLAGRRRLPAACSASPRSSATSSPRRRPRSSRRSSRSPTTPSCCAQYADVLMRGGAARQGRGACSTPPRARDPDDVLARPRLSARLPARPQPRGARLSRGAARPRPRVEYQGQACSACSTSTRSRRLRRRARFGEAVRGRPAGAGPTPLDAREARAWRATRCGGRCCSSCASAWSEAGSSRSAVIFGLRAAGPRDAGGRRRARVARALRLVWVVPPILERG